ncbi:ribonuclease H-like YkuK family protein [Neolewinella lacunae]|nr:ribonuclease H-like YkuK family protein [Neolewinella lacunae]MDN3633036.1 ribonuclease H-like YkuK family protein [Neolewinella lacunae]
MNVPTLTEMKWRRYDGRKLEVPVVEAVRQTLIKEREAGHRLKVCIGTDSQVRGSVTEFATVIVFLREKKGGFMFIANYKSEQDMSIRERMILEVARSVEIAYALCNLLDEHKVELEVHADINTDPHFKSNTALTEAMGYILGMGFAFKAKPDAFASSACADKVC